MYIYTSISLSLSLNPVWMSHQEYMYLAFLLRGPKNLKTCKLSMAPNRISKGCNWVPWSMHFLNVWNCILRFSSRSCFLFSSKYFGSHWSLQHSLLTSTHKRDEKGMIPLVVRFLSTFTVVKTSETILSIHVPTAFSKGTPDPWALGGEPHPAGQKRRKKDQELWAAVCPNASKNN